MLVGGLDNKIISIDVKNYAIKFLGSVKDKDKINSLSMF